MAQLQRGYSLLVNPRLGRLSLPGFGVAHQRAYTEDRIHETGLFLPWHRAFLYSHERTLAALLNDPGFRLPVWDWEDPDGIPAAEALCAETWNGQPNPLFFGLRDWSFPGNAAAQLHEEWLAQAKAPTFDYFGGKLAGVNGWANSTAALAAQGPHARVHNGVNGVMAYQSSSAFDPLFYFHHANVDRLWQHRRSLWPNADIDPGSEFAKKKLSFPVLKLGRAVKLSWEVGWLLNVERDLRYRYASYPAMPAAAGGLQAWLGIRFPADVGGEWVARFPSPSWEEPLEVSVHALAGGHGARQSETAALLSRPKAALLDALARMPLPGRAERRGLDGGTVAGNHLALDVELIDVHFV